MQQVFGGYRANLGGQFRSPEGHNLIGMNLGSQAKSLRSNQQLSGLIHGKYAFFAEYIAKLRQTAGSDPGQYFVQQMVHIFVGPSFILRRHGVRPHEGRRHFHDMFPVELRHDFQLLEFCRRVQAIAALAFHSRYPERQHGTQPLPANSRQFLRRGLPRGFDRIDDPTAPLHDLHVGIAAQPPGKLLFPMTGKQKMRMRIDESRQYTATGGIDQGRI